MDSSSSEFPKFRARRTRYSEAHRRLVRETRLHPDQFVMPYFVREGTNVKEEIASMPGQFRFSPDTLLAEIDELISAGIRSVLLFGIPEEKDERASAAADTDGVIQKTVREIKQRFKDLLVITDVCLCAYMSHGHCGVIDETGRVANDPSLKILADVALSHAEAGADLIAPSDMMDGRIQAIRAKLDSRGFQELPIMSYSAKYASAFYGPFRDAAHSAPQTGSFGSGPQPPKDRKTYQMDPANAHEAVREVLLDVKEGADIVMVKPALAYLDVISEITRAVNIPVAAYAVSGEYSMIKTAAEKGILDEKMAVLEIMTGLTRAGARVLISYHSKVISGWLREGQLISDKKVTFFS